MLYESHLFSAASGKLSGLVASRNRGGPYVRAYVVPVDPMTTEQNYCRSAWSYLATYWKTTLTATQRARWAALAQGVRLPNRLGIERQPTGRSLFFRQNFHRAQVQEVSGDTYTPVANPPTHIGGDIGDLPSTAVQNSTNSVVRFTWTETPAWTADTTSILLIYASTLCTTQINHYFGPWTLVNYTVSGDWATPLDVTMATGFNLTSGKRIFYRMLVTFQDGRLSNVNTGHQDG